MLLTESVDRHWVTPIRFHSVICYFTRVLVVFVVPGNREREHFCGFFLHLCVIYKPVVGQRGFP